MEDHEMKNILIKISLAALSFLAFGLMSNGQNVEKIENGVAWKQYINPTGATTETIQSITTETFVTGLSQTTTEQKPVHAALVLDVSGSMEEDLAVGNTSSLDMLDTTYGATAGFYYFYYRPGLITHTYPLRYYNGQWQYKPYYSNNYTNIAGSSFESQITSKALTVYVEKIDALKMAVSKFVDVVHANAVEHDIENKISIVKFASDDYYSSNHLSEGNHEEYTELVKNFGEVKTTSGANTIKSAVNALEAEGATAVDYGLTIATELFDQTAEKNSDASKVVVMFTDGEPNHGSGFSTSVATEAAKKAKTLKDGGVIVYTVGVFSNPSNNVLNYMNAVSSNHPTATTYNVDDTSVHGYFQNANNQIDLASIFSSIATEIGGSSVSYSTTTTVCQNFNNNFKLPDNADVNSITVKVASCTGVTGDGSSWSNYSWGTPTNATGVTKTIVNGNVQVNGFDFSAHWCGLENGANHSAGQKLIITIPVVATANNTGGDMNIGTGTIEDGDDTRNEGSATLNTVNITFNVKGLNKEETLIFDILNSSDEIVGHVIITNEAGTTADTISSTIKSLPSGTYTAVPNGWNLRSLEESYGPYSEAENVENIDLSTTTLTENVGESCKVNRFFTN